MVNLFPPFPLTAAATAPFKYNISYTNIARFYRSSTQSPPTWLLQLLPAGRPMYRRPRWPPCWNNPSTFRALLPFLRRRALSDVACYLRVTALQASSHPDIHGGHLLEGLCGHFSVHLLGDEELNELAGVVMGSNGVVYIPGEVSGDTLTTLCTYVVVNERRCNESISIN